jgi:hypothetical protein
MEDKILAELKALRQDLEVSGAINIIEGINTIETLALVGHWVTKRRAPSPSEAQQLSRAARQRWAEQIRHTLALMKADGTELDERMADLAELMAARPTKSSEPAKTTASTTKPRTKTKKRKRG